MTLTGFAVRRPVTTTMFFLALAILGCISWTRLPLQLFPELIFPEVFVTFNLNGASAEQVEREMVILAEGEIGKLDGVQVMESYCRANSGGVRISYAPDTDMKFALLQLQNRMSRLQPLFPDRTRVNVQRFDSADLSATIMQLNVLGDGDLNWLREFAEQKIRPELEAVDGVVTAQVLGGRREAIEIIVDPLMMQAHQLSLTQVRSRINAANQRRKYLGHVYNVNQALPVSMHEQFEDIKQIEDVVIKPEIPLHLGDIANIRYGAQTQTDVQRVNGKPSVGIRIQKDDDANLIDVSRAVETTIKRINKDFETEEIELVVSNSQAEMMEEALDTLKQAAIIGGGLGLFVLFLFLRNLRFVMVLLLAIPASLLMTFNLMYAWDLSLNMLSLCGLALAVGMLTDNGIVVMENIFKHFELGKSPLEAAREGTEEVARAVLAATATTVTVFLPVVFIQSDAQDILRELALAMTFPLLASLLVALTLVPALSAYTLSGMSRPPTGKGLLLERYTVLLKSGLRHRTWVTIGIVLCFIGTIVVSFFFMLQQDIRQEESQFTAYVSLPEGATLEATDEVVVEVESAIRDVVGLDRFLTSVQENQASVTVLLKDLNERPNQISVEQIKEKLDEKFAGIGNAVIGYDVPARAGRGGGRGGGGGGGRQSSGGFNLTGAPQTEQAVIRGHDFSVLQMLADDLAFRLEELEGVVDPSSVRPDVERSAPEVQVLPDEAMMFDRQLNIQTVLASVGDARADGFQTGVPFLTPSGLEISIDVRTIEDPKTDSPGLQEFRTMPIISPNGQYVVLDEVSHVRTDQGRSMILRTDQSRRAMVAYQFTTEVLDSQPALDEARKFIRDVIQEMVLPNEYSIEIVEAEEETIYYWMMGIAALLIYMILASLFESFSAPLIILCTLPTAIIGSCWALVLSDTGLTQQEGPMALLGFIVLLGIAVNNGIMLIDAINTLRSEHGFRRERAVLTAGRSRVRPILMTSATTLLGVMPLALKFGGDYEIWPPFAITVFGGLTVSMVSTLIFIPVVYMGLDQVKEWLVQIGTVGIILASLITIGCVYGVDTFYQSLLWTTLSVLPIWFAWLTFFWILGRIRQSRESAKQHFGEVTAIQLRNLTKIYGAPGKFKQEWLRFQRRDERVTDGTWASTPTVRDTFWWKLPLLGLIGYLHTYFEDAVWIYLLGLITWAIMGKLVSDILLLTRLRITSIWVRRLGIWVLPLAFLAFVHLRLKLLSVTLATLSFYLLINLVKLLVNRVRVGKVDLENLEGRLSGAKGLVYRSAVGVPLLGLPKPEFRALGGVDLEIERGMFGLLGPNGAGKTTMMRIICQVLMPSYGSVVVNGRNMLHEKGLQGVIGYLPQHFGLYDHMSAFDYLEYRALLEGFNDGAQRRHRVSECLEQVNLDDRKDDLIGSFSGGMKQRVGIAQTLLHLPQIIVVDEPTAGLDPLERIRFRNLLARFSQDHIVIFSTHIVEDISGSCNKLAVLNNGQVIYTGQPQDMLNLAKGRVWEAVVSEDMFDKMEVDLEMITHVRTPGGIRARFLSQSAVANALPSEPNLEDAYLYLLRHGSLSC